MEEPERPDLGRAPIIKRNLGVVVTADLLAANNTVLCPYRHITVPECRQYLLGQAFKEVIHTHAYEVHRGIAGFDEKEIFSVYMRSRRSATRTISLIPFIEVINDPQLHAGTLENNPKLLRSIIAFACPVESLFFYVGYTNPGAGPPEQDKQRRRAVHSARQVDALQLRH